MSSIHKQIIIITQLAAEMGVISVAPTVTVIHFTNEISIEHNY